MTTTATFDEFTEAFIAALVERGVVSLDPNSEATNFGIGRIHMFLAQRAEESDDLQSRRWYTRLKNSLAPSNIGTYDYFLAALRSCQIGFASSPNPRYSEIAFKVSKPHAELFLGKLDKTLREAAETAADQFVHQSINAVQERRTGDKGADVSRANQGIATRVVR